MTPAARREQPILAWYFAALDKPPRIDAHGDGSAPDDLLLAPGYVYSYDGAELPALCSRGLHASRTVLDALQYARTGVLCRVACWGDVIEGDDKLVARHREVLWMGDVSSELRLFACWSVRQIWHLVTDERSRRAVEVAERHALGQATDQELAAARDAAWAAARDAARDAARNAARDAAWAAAWAAARNAARDAAWAAARDAARDAAWAAAWAAARNAARNAAWAAAWAAARNAARNAAWAAARAAAWAAQRSELERRIRALLPRGVK